MTNENLFFSLPDNKIGLLERINLSWNLLQDTVKGLSETQLTTSKDQAGWSILDHLTHIAVWENALIAILQRSPIHRALDIDPTVYQQLTSEDQENEIIRQNTQKLPLPTALAYCQQSHQQVLTAIDVFPEEHWSKPSTWSQPDDSNTNPIIQRIAGNTYSHYAEHRPWIAALIK